MAKGTGKGVIMRASVLLQSNIESSFGKVRRKVAFTWGTDILQGLCRDRGRGMRFHGVLVFPAYIARTFAFECI